MRETSGQTSLLVGLVLVMMLVGYVASFPPVAKLTDTLGVGRGAVETVYQPLIWLHDHTPLRRPLEWYAGLWGVR